MGHIACIGSRSLSENQIQVCEKIGEWIVHQGHTLHSGNAPGADQAYARGGNRIDPSRVYLHLPWPNFERQAIHRDNVVRTVEDLSSAERLTFSTLATQYHGAYSRLSQGAKKLIVRNGMIVLPNGPVDLVIALPGDYYYKPHGGGTGQGMRLAQAHNIDLFNIAYADKQGLWDLCERIRHLG